MRSNSRNADLSAGSVRLRLGSALAALTVALSSAAACESDSREADPQSAAATPDASTSRPRRPGAGSDGGPTGAGSDGSPGDPADEDASAAGSGGDDGESEAATFTSLYQTAFWTCKSDVCHGAGLAGLDMTSQDAAHASLVGVPAANMGGMCGEMNLVRVVPGKPDASLLFLKLSSDTPCGQQMPPGGQLPSDVREQVRRWIERGAPND